MKFDMVIAIGLILKFEIFKVLHGNYMGMNNEFTFM